MKKTVTFGVAALTLLLIIAFSPFAMGTDSNPSPSPSYTPSEPPGGNFEPPPSEAPPSSTVGTPTAVPSTPTPTYSLGPAPHISIPRPHHKPAPALPNTGG